MQALQGRSLRVAHRLAALALAACAGPLCAGQTGSSFQLSVTLLPADAGSGCTTTIGPNGNAVVSCRPPVISAGSGSSPGNGEPVIGYRTHDPRVKVAEVIEEEAESYYAWGEYSSHMIVAGGREYVEMRVSW